MPKRALSESLKELHLELERSERVDEESAALLREMAEDIGRLLNEPGESEGSDENSTPTEEISERITELAASFEADHPRLAATVRRVINSLSAMGI